MMDTINDFKRRILLAKIEGGGSLRSFQLGGHGEIMKSKKWIERGRNFSVRIQIQSSALSALYKGYYCILEEY